MTVRFVSLCLVALLCLGVAASASAAGPLGVPAGLAGKLTEALEQFLNWINELSAAGPEVVPSG